MLFPGMLPSLLQFFGVIPRIPKSDLVPDKALQPNELAKLSNIGGITKYVHTYVAGA